MFWWVIISQRVAVRIHIPIQRLRGDHFAVDDERGAQRLHARAGLRPVLPAPGAQAQVSVAEGSVRVAEMTGHEVVMTEPSAGIVSLMRGGWPS
jgi:hypothetical protein